MNQQITPPPSHHPLCQRCWDNLKKQKLLLYIEFILIVFVIEAPLALMSLHLDGSFQLIKNLVSSLLVALPFIFIRPRFRSLSLIPVWLVTIFILTNLWYFRFFRDFIPLPNYFLVGNFTGDLFGAGLEMVKTKDVAIAAPAILLTIAFALRLFRSANAVEFSKRERIGISAAVLLLLIGYDVAIMFQVTKQKEAKAIAEAMIGKYNPLRSQLSPMVDYLYTDFHSYIFRNALQPICRQFVSYELTPEDFEIMDAFEARHSRLAAQTPDLTAEFSGNTNKNLIFIVVESLNAWAVDAEVNGRKVMPFLSELMDADGVVSSTELVNQIHNGVSSDGQFIYNTGMYAASDETTVNCYLENDLPALPKVFGSRPSFEVICESPNMWQHTQSNKSYGYKDFHYNTDLIAREQGLGRDKAMFNKAIEVIDTIGKPFFGLLITMTMHGPFKDPNVKRQDWIWSDTKNAEITNDYLQSCNYFDTCLREFFDELKQKGLYDSSVIVIASDHSARVDNNVSDKIVLAITGSGITRCITHPIGQVDVFPTVLQIMNRFSPEKYTGMGLSVFNPALCGAMDRNGKIQGEQDSILNLAQPAANIYLRANTYPHRN